jgi:hypothetical protein
MKTLDCSAVEDLLDLYAAGECDPRSRNDVHAHLAGCEPCRHKLDETRQIVGLIGLHYRTPAALARLKQRIEEEAHPRPAVIRLRPRINTFAAVAALVLVTFGLGLWLPVLSLPAGRPEPRIELALVSSLKANGGDPRVAMMMKKAVPAMERGKRQEPPLPPRLSRGLVLRNPQAYPLTVDLGAADIVLDLKGPGVRREKGKAPTKVESDVRTIPPGGETPLPVERLVSRLAGRTEYLYPTKPGDYTLWAHVYVPAWREGHPEEESRLLLKAGPIRLPLTPEE